MSDLRPDGSRKSGPGNSIDLPGADDGSGYSDRNVKNNIPTSDVLMSQVLQQLKIMNIHLAKLSDMWIGPEEVNNG